MRYKKARDPRNFIIHSVFISDNDPLNGRMKFFVALFAILASAAAAGVSTEYLPPVQEAAVLPSNEYLPPVAAPLAIAAEEPTILADDGYRYKTVKRYRLRHRRDVNELPSNEYLPPGDEAQFVAPQPQPEVQTVLADDGYRYKTVKRYRLRHRRDVNELPSNEYLPPGEEAQFVAPQPQPEVQTVLADDGYRYKTVKRYRLRHRRDVNELPSNEYLPPGEEAQFVAPQSQPEVQTVLADDGYRYKTVKRYRLRHRRDVNELPSNEYLPPGEEAQFTAPQPQPEVQTVLADDGYRYKTVKRYRLRHRRDVNELPSNEYLPPGEEAQFVAPQPQPEVQTVLADDGYRYKTVKRYRLRHRRDVNELPSNEYLPPSEEAQFVAPQPQPEVQTVLADDGYRYKTVKRYRLRHRRDVNELPSNEYLPPGEEAQFVAPQPQPEVQTVLADDGYRYKTVKRYRLRHRRDVNELPSNEYLPPGEEAQFVAPQPQPEVQTVLADDGYRYKTVKRYRLRHRRDVNELPSNEYLPPGEEAQFVAPQPQPEVQTVLADDGYRYKTVKRFRLRRH